MNMSTDTTDQVVANLVRAKKHEPGALLPILHDIQDMLGYIPTESVGVIARELNLSRAEVHGVVTFYHHFRSEPPKQKVVQICRAEACQAMGAEHLWAHACASANGAFTLEPVYCLGLCSSSPAISIDAKLHARVDAERFERLVAANGNTL